MIHLYLVFFIFSSEVLGNKYLNMLSGKRLPSLSMSILYGFLHLLATSFKPCDKY